MPVIVTAVALAAVTVNVDDLPDVIEVGLAVMLTVGAGESRLRSRLPRSCRQLRSRLPCTWWSRSG